MNESLYCVLCACPDMATAQSLARQLIENRLAACVQVIAGVTSYYRWQGAVQSASEGLLVIKTPRDKYPDLEKWLAQAHPYECPEIVALTVANSLPAYAQWVYSSLISSN